MDRIFKVIVFSFALLMAHDAVAQSADDTEQLKIAALEALMAAPAEKALPIVARVMTSNNSDEVKSRALFVLSQIDEPQAHEILLETARTEGGDLQMQAIRMMGISGNSAVISQLIDVYRAGDSDVREAVLHAYLIAGEKEAVYEIAAAAANDEEFETAVQVLGTMGATEQLQRLRDHPGATESLIRAYAISGDTESLLILARDNSNPEKQLQAIQGLSIAGGAEDANAALLDIYRSSDSRDIREAVMRSMMVSGYDEGLLELFRASQDSQEKAELLRQLVIMDSDAAMEAIDATLTGEQ